MKKRSIGIEEVNTIRDMMDDYYKKKKDFVGLILAKASAAVMSAKIVAKSVVMIPPAVSGG